MSAIEGWRFGIGSKLMLAQALSFGISPRDSGLTDIVKFHRPRRPVVPMSVLQIILDDGDELGGKAPARFRWRVINCK
jgi:hypothetical protein